MKGHLAVRSGPHVESQVVYVDGLDVLGLVHHLDAHQGVLVRVADPQLQAPVAVAQRLVRVAQRLAVR